MVIQSRLKVLRRLMKQQLLDKEQSLMVQEMLRDFENGDLSEEETLKLQKPNKISHFLRIYDIIL